MRDIRRFSSFRPSLATILCLQQAFRMVINWDRYPEETTRQRRREGRAGDGGRSDEGTARLLAELIETLSVIGKLLLKVDQ
jgi:hypothetical protein